MKDEIFIAGAGGQGVIAVGKILAQAAVEEDKFVTYFPSYGAEVRGGTANCDLILSDTEIGSPVASQVQAMLIMNLPSFNKFLNRLTSDGTLIVNSSLVEIEKEHPGLRKKIKYIVEVPATEIAHKLGNIRCANIVMLAAYAKARKTLSSESIIKAITVMFSGKENLVDLNIKAFNEGLKG